MKINRNKYLVAIAFAVIAISYLLFLRDYEISKQSKIYEETFTFEKDTSAYLPKHIKLLNNLSFEYTAQESSGGFDLIKIDAEIINNNRDTVYFLSTSCYGEQYSVIYDEQNFRFSQPRYVLQAIPLFMQFHLKQLVNLRFT